MRGYLLFLPCLQLQRRRVPISSCQRRYRSRLDGFRRHSALLPPGRVARTSRSRLGTHTSESFSTIPSRLGGLTPSIHLPSILFTPPYFRPPRLKRRGQYALVVGGSELRDLKNNGLDCEMP